MFLCRQWMQITSCCMERPHSPQYFEYLGFSVWQCGHFIKSTSGENHRSFCTTRLDSAGASVAANAAYFLQKERPQGALECGSGATALFLKCSTCKKLKGGSFAAALQGLRLQYIRETFLCVSRHKLVRALHRILPACFQINPNLRHLFIQSAKEE
jgi:hypothetical protein